MMDMSLCLLVLRTVGGFQKIYFIDFIVLYVAFSVILLKT